MPSSKINPPGIATASCGIEPWTLMPRFSAFSTALFVEGTAAPRALVARRAAEMKILVSILNSSSGLWSMEEFMGLQNGGEFPLSYTRLKVASGWHMLCVEFWSE